MTAYLAPIGLLIISTVAAAVGYLVASVTWNWWVRHKRRIKLEQLMAGRESQ